MGNVDAIGARTRLEIVAEQRLGHWLAWFETCPETQRAGASAWSAITALIGAFGWNIGHVQIVEHSVNLLSADSQPIPDPVRPTLVLAVNSSCSTGFVDHIWDLLDDSFDGVNGPVNATSVAFGEPNLEKGKRQTRQSDRAKRSRAERLT